MLMSCHAMLLPCWLQSLLGQVDLAFLAAYAAGMFFAGHLGDRTDLRVFLSVGMLGSGIFCTLFGMVGTSSRPALNTV
jgi:sugar phosphate permease